MSGEKYVQVTERQLSKMMSACREVDQHREVQQRLRAELGQAAQEITRRANEAQARYTGYEASLAGMSEEMRRQEQDHLGRLRAERARFDGELATLGDRLTGQRGEFLDLLDSQGEEFFSALEAQGQALQGQIDSLANSIAGKAAHEAERARYWLNDTRAKVEAIAQHYPNHPVFATGEIDALRRELQLAEATLRDECLATVAIGNVKETKLRADALHTRLDRLQRQWDQQRAAAHDGCLRTLEFCQAAAMQRILLDTGAGSQELAAEIDYWTEGALGRLQDKVRAQLATLAGAQPESVSLADLNGAIADSSAWREEANRLVGQAREQLILSIRRQNIATRAAEVMRKKGWALVDSAYEGAEVDSRGWLNAFHLHLRNTAGDEVMTIVAPATAAEGGSHRVSFRFRGRGNDETINLALAEGVRGALAGAGVDVAAPQAVPRHERQRADDGAPWDFRQIRQKRRSARKA